MSEVTGAIINWNSGPMLKSAVESLLTDEVEGVVVVDNASSDGSLQAIRSLRERIIVIENVANLGFAGAINQAFKATTTPFVLIMNPDARATAGAVRALVDVFEQNPKAGVAGGFINDRYLPRPFPTMWSLIRENLGMPPARSPLSDGNLHVVDQPAGAALMVRREAFDQAGGFDEQFYPAWYEDVDFCRSVSEAGWEIYYNSAAVFEHDGGYSLEALGFERFLATYYDNQIRYIRKHCRRRARFAIRASLVLGMLVKIVGRPRRAGAYWRVLWDALTD
jgi:GT2 family glycosyltransferase